LSRVITGVESWIYGYGPETKQQPFQWESRNSPRPKEARHVKSKVKSMLIIFFDIKEIVHKEFVLAYSCIILWCFSASPIEGKTERPLFWHN
jgi:hypothetical protein